MEKEFGALHYDRRDVQRPMEQCARLIDRVRSGELDTTFAPGLTSKEEIDGVKMNFADGSWLLFRKSGTEPIIRIYCESPDAALVQTILDRASRNWTAGDTTGVSEESHAHLMACVFSPQRHRGERRRTEVLFQKTNTLRTTNQQILLWAQRFALHVKHGSVLECGSCGRLSQISIRR